MVRGCTYRRVGARSSTALRIVDNSDHDRADRKAGPYVYASSTLGVNARFCRCPSGRSGLRRWGNLLRSQSVAQHDLGVQAVQVTERLMLRQFTAADADDLL